MRTNNVHRAHALLVLLAVQAVAWSGACVSYDDLSSSSADADNAADTQFPLDEEDAIHEDVANEHVATAPSAIGGFSSSLFKFSTIVHEPGTGPGGWQEARATLKFADTRHGARWSCPVVVGTPIRSAVWGHMTKSHAADISAAVADHASSRVMHTRPEWLPALFCIKFVDDMNLIFREDYKGLGASARSR
jgi:hypothetical protein